MDYVFRSGFMFWSNRKVSIVKWLGVRVEGVRGSYCAGMVLLLFLLLFVIFFSYTRIALFYLGVFHDRT